VVYDYNDNYNTGFSSFIRRVDNRVNNSEALEKRMCKLFDMKYTNVYVKFKKNLVKIEVDGSVGGEKDKKVKAVKKALGGCINCVGEYLLIIKFTKFLNRLEKAEKCDVEKIKKQFKNIKQKITSG